MSDETKLVITKWQPKIIDGYRGGASDDYYRGSRWECDLETQPHREKNFFRLRLYGENV
jgi:hypothetical protein